MAHIKKNKILKKKKKKENQHSAEGKCMIDLREAVRDRHIVGVLEWEPGTELEVKSWSIKDSPSSFKILNVYMENSTKA